MDVEAILEGLNAEQRAAVETVRGPVCILAGAGSGKTTTITRRIAYQVATSTFAPSEILAVTFTDKAANELRERLARLGVGGVVARTFHSAAYAQLRGLADDPPARVLPSKTHLLREIGNRLPGAYRFRPAADLATEIEWAKNRRIGPERYRAAAEGRRTPLPPDLMVRVFRQYEAAKAAQGSVDFEDLLELAIRLFDEQSGAAERFRTRYRAFTVDEYQDVNLLQQELLDRWLGGRDELCAVGDDFQSIYAFTGASPEHLLGMPDRFPHAAVVRLEENYRSTPQVLELANRLVPSLGGAPKQLRPQLPDGPDPLSRSFDDRDGELAFVVGRVRELHAEGVAWEQCAVLYRLNARSEDYEEAFAAAGIPFQVRGAAFLARPAARRLLRRLDGVGSPDVADTVRDAAEADGLLAVLPEGLGEQEETRQADLARLVRLAQEFDGSGSVADFLADLESRFRSDGDGRGVNLLTYHRAKGLEFDAVILPRLEEKELPVRQADSEAAVQEERRLLYVGITRARRHLTLTWAGRPSRFLRELRLSAGGTAASRPARSGRSGDVDLSPPARALRAWRLERARLDGVPAYVVFPDRTLEELVRRTPSSAAELAAVPGLGPSRIERYGPDVLRVLEDALSGEATTAAAPA